MPFVSMLLSVVPSPVITGEDPALRWQAFTTPGESHGRLESFVGSWTTRTSVWLEPGGEPYAVSSGTARHYWLETGRWLAMESTGTLEGIPHHGFGIVGYDNFKQKYVASFVDNISTAILSMEGTLDAAGAAILLFGEVDEPLTGEHDRAVRYEFRKVGGDSLSMRVFDLPRGAASLVLEIGFRRDEADSR